MRKYNLDSFELSQAYLFFWDKLEKANYFLENIIDLADEDLDSRLVQRVLADPVSDGGQWDMVYNLVEKYGLVPQALVSLNQIIPLSYQYGTLGKKMLHYMMRHLFKFTSTAACHYPLTRPDHDDLTCVFS